jgi:hypothetical protein
MTKVVGTPEKFVSAKQIASSAENVRLSEGKEAKKIKVSEVFQSSETRYLNSQLQLLTRKISSILLTGNIFVENNQGILILSPIWRIKVIIILSLSSRKNKNESIIGNFVGYVWTFNRCLGAIRQES